MKKYMVIYVAGGKQGAAFFDKYKEAEDFRMNTVCGMGGDAEVYERTEFREGVEGIAGCPEYQLIYA